MIAPNMTPPSATLFLNQTTTVAGHGGYSQVGTIEGWIQLSSNKNAIKGVVGVAQGQKPVRLWEDPQRLLTLTGRTLSGVTDEFWIEFSSASGKLLFSSGGEADAPFADGHIHHFALTLDQTKGLGLGFDGSDPAIISDKWTDEKRADVEKADSLFQPEPPQEHEESFAVTYQCRAL
jgi:hypothetical protein